MICVMFCRRYRCEYVLNHFVRECDFKFKYCCKVYSTKVVVLRITRMMSFSVRTFKFSLNIPFKGYNVIILQLLKKVNISSLYSN